MARLGVMAAKNLRTLVSTESPAKKSLSPALSSGDATRISGRGWSPAHLGSVHRLSIGPGC